MPVATNNGIICSTETGYTEIANRVRIVKDSE